jgi:hypothetical protein
MSLLNQRRGLRGGPSDLRTPCLLRRSPSGRGIVLPERTAKSRAGLLTAAFGPVKVVYARRGSLPEGLGRPGREWEAPLPQGSQFVTSRPAESRPVLEWPSGDRLHSTNWTQGDSILYTHFHIKSHLRTAAPASRGNWPVRRGGGALSSSCLAEVTAAGCCEDPAPPGEPLCTHLNRGHSHDRVSNAESLRRGCCRKRISISQSLWHGPGSH